MAALVACAAALTGCSASLPRSVSSAPVLSVVTGLFPLAEAAQIVGGTKVAVDDVVPPGADPFTYHPDQAQAATLRAAGLVVLVGGGFQPSLEAASAGAPAVLNLRSRLHSANPYVWLDPPTMIKAVQAIASSMSAADPEAGPLFSQNAVSFEDEISSLGGDFSSTLSTCPEATLVTPDEAFTTMAADYGLHDVVVTPATPTGGVLARLPVGTTSLALQEPWVDGSGVAAVATAGHLPTRTEDTLAGPPSGGWPPGSDYFMLMEKNLSSLGSALGCSGGQQ